ncbi:hypothetical protein FB451DRAFT_1412324 [Mycena latifolia]|nr:hypothetical protein FB451DRAFT_1412324 [Mycena latifolia]
MAQAACHSVLYKGGLPDGGHVHCPSISDESLLMKTTQPHTIRLRTHNVFTRSFLTLALSFVTIASVLSCDVDGRLGTCEFTSNCHAPMFEHVPGYCPGLAGYQYCITTG